MSDETARPTATKTRQFPVDVLTPGAKRRRLELTMAPVPAYAELAAKVAPLIGGSIEHVRIWDKHQEIYASMFVDEQSISKGLPRNEAATKIYRANMIAHSKDPRAKLDPERLPAIYGAAVVFKCNVWR